MSKTKEWQSSISWRCLVCEDKPEFEHKEMMEHMRAAHGFDPKTTKATRNALMHLDGSDFYLNTYEYEVNGMKFLKYDHGQRE